MPPKRVAKVSPLPTTRVTRSAAAAARKRHLEEEPRGESPVKKRGTKETVEEEILGISNLDIADEPKDDGSDTVIKKKDTVVKKKVTVPKKKVTVAKKKDTVVKNEDTVEEKNDDVVKIEDTVSKKEHRIAEKEYVVTTDQVTEFCDQTNQSDEKIAKASLTWVRGNMRAAIDHYDQNRQHYVNPAQCRAHVGRVKALFARYANDPADALPGKMGPNGIYRLLDDLKLDAEDRKVLVLAYKLKAAIQCEFSSDEWEKGMTEMGVDSVESLRIRLDQIDEGLKEPSQFKPLYQFTFGYGKSAGQRNLDLDVALIYWKILFKDQFALFPIWEQYLTTEHKKAVTRDAWNMLFDFLSTTKDDLSNYDEEQAWPVVLDEFVKWARSRLTSETMQEA